MMDDDLKDVAYIREKSTSIIKDFIISVENHLEIKNNEYNGVQLATMINVVTYLAKKIVMASEKTEELRWSLLYFIMNKVRFDIEEFEREIKKSH